MSNNINENESIFQRPRNRYLSRSSFLNVKNRIGRYDGDNRVKTLKEIQEDEIEKIKRYDPTTFEFFQLFTNPILISAKQQTQNFKLSPQIQIPDPQIFSRITGIMTQLFVNDVKGIRKLKISSKMINEISDLKEKLMVEINQERMIGQEQKKGFRERFKGLFQRFLGKKSTEQISLQVKETEKEELKLIMSVFYEIINSFKILRSIISDINISFFINTFFPIKIDDIFKQFPEFTREPSLMHLRNIQCQFNLLSFAVFLGIEPLIVFFLLLGGNPSLTNQLNQDSSYHIMFFQMIFRNTAMNIRWKPSEKNEDKVYNSYHPEIELYEKMIKNLQSIDPVDTNLVNQISMRLNQLKSSIEMNKSKSTEQLRGKSLTIDDLQREIESLKAMIVKQQNEFKQQIQQKQQQQLQQPQQIQQQPQQIQKQNQLKLVYNFDRYLFSNNKLRRILTLLSFFGTGINLSLLVLQSDMVKKYIIDPKKKIILERVSSSILIAMAKEKFLNEKNILIIDSKYVKYSVYDLLRYFLIFNGYDSSNFTKYLRNTGYRNNTQTDNDYITRIARGARSLGNQQLSVLESLSLPPMPFNFISNINETSKPFNYSFFFYLISNKDISVNHKIELCCISLLQGADPNITPNIAEDILSQLDSKVNKLSICDIFKVFLGSNYEKLIRIFKLYSTQFSKGVWTDKYGEIAKIMEKQKYIIDELKRQQLTLQNSVPLANITQPFSQQLSSLNLANSSQLQYPKRVNTIPQLSSLNLATSPLQSQKRVKALNSPLQELPITQLQQTDSINPLFGESASSTLTTVPTAHFQKRGDLSLVGGSKIKLRTFHFLEPKSYNEHAFRAEKPIIAGKMAYDFLRTHYKLKKGSSIMFTIEDRIKDRKYNYIGEKVNNKIIIKST